MRKIFALSFTLLMLCCGVTASQHAQNVQSSADYNLLLAKCLTDARTQPPGAQLAYYHKCACTADVQFAFDSGLCHD